MPLTYAPDGDRTAPGVLIAASDCVPTNAGGYRSIGNVTNTVAQTATGGTFGMYIATFPDGESRYFYADGTGGSGSKAQLFRTTVLSSPASVVSKSGNYTASQRWRFTNFGNYVIATNGIETPQYYLDGTSTLFADLAGGVPTTAKLVETVGDWVFFAHTNTSGDHWITSDQSDPTAYNGGSANLQFSGQLVDPGGSITSIRAFNNDVVMFKDRAIWMGSFQDATIGWYWVRVGVSTGCTFHEATVPVGNSIYYFDLYNRNFFVFDGTRPQPIGGMASQALWRQMTSGYTSGSAQVGLSRNVFGVHDPVNNLVVWFYDGAASGSAIGQATAWVAFNYNTGAWSYGPGFAYAADGKTIKVTSAITDKLYAQGSTISVMSRAPYCFIGTGGSGASTATVGAFANIAGDSRQMTLRLGPRGSNHQSIRLVGVRPKYVAPLSIPGDTTLAIYDTPSTSDGVNVASDYTLNAALSPDTADYTTVAGTWSSTRNEFDILADAKWHMVETKFTPTADKILEINDIDLVWSPAGQR